MDALRRLRRDLSGVLRAVRGDLAGLRASIDPDGLGAAVVAAADDVAARAGMHLHVTVREEAGRLPAAVEVELVRIAQEALRNAGRHAGARNLWLTCDIVPPDALVRVADDGRGITPGAGRRDSYGFVTMAERAQLLGASLVVQERQPTGTCVEVRLGSGGRRTARTGANDGEHDDGHRTTDEAEPDAGQRPARR